ncbi:MAG TPA: high frequency lysogenization protein HflD [Pseudomonadales bacterium]|nr:high frequency lysogenization protein HflD [Pseudomonadales bacterium]
MSRASITDQTLALAGIAQAATLASQLAREGSADSNAMAGTVHSILMLDADNTESIFIDKDHLRKGLQTVRDTFERDTAANAEILRYCASLLHLQRQLAKNREMLDTIGRRILQIQKQVDIHGSETNSQVINSIAGLYSDTLSTLKFRIQINGNPQHLQQDNVASQIRTALMGGVRAALLWRQLGGSRLDFILQRKAIYNATMTLLGKRAA